MAPVRPGKALTVSAAIACGVSACATFVPYSGGELSDEKVATVHCYSRNYLVYIESCGIRAVDGLRPAVSQMLGNTSKVPPGSHWIEVAFESHFGGGGGVTAVCAFDIELEAGAVYQVKAHSLTKARPRSVADSAAGFHRGFMEIGIARPATASEVRRVEATCSSSGGSMCRKDDDCVHHPDIACFPQEGFPFGQCRLRGTGR